MEITAPSWKESTLSQEWERVTHLQIIYFLHKATKDHQIRNLNDEIAHQDELINKLNKEKKQTQEVNQKTAEDLQVFQFRYLFPIVSN